MCQCALFLLQNLCYNFQALMPFKLLAVISPGGQSAGRQESGGGGWEAPWHQSPLPACSSAQPGTGTAGTGVNTLLHRPRSRHQHSQLASPLTGAILNSSQTPFNTAKNQFNQQRENRSGEMRVRECGLKRKQSKREGPCCSLSPLASHSGDFVAHFSTKGEVEQ